MTARDRLVLVVVAVAALCAGGWFVLVKPQRDDAAALGAQLTEERTRLSSAQAAAAQAEQARKRYATDYATVARLGKAIPADDDVASLVYQLEAAADRHGVDFRSVKSSGAAPAAAPAAAPPAAQVAQTGADAKGEQAKPASGTAPATQAAAAQAPAGTQIGAAGLPTLPFSFTFESTYLKLQKFLGALDDLTVVRQGGLVIRGRLLTLDSVNIKESPEGLPRVQAEVTATAYLVPPTEGLTAGATPQGPAAAPVTSTQPSGGSTPAPPVATATGGIR